MPPTPVATTRCKSEPKPYVVPDSFTHDTSEQRLRWLERGFKTGDISKGNTFRMRYEDL